MIDKNSCAMKPPMGWNSWDCYAANVTEKQLIDNAEYMSRNMLSFGWEYIICDIQWYEPLAGTEEGEYRPFAELCMDEYSRLLPAPNRFPSSASGKGFKPISDKIHDMGLKFGIHYMRGIPRQAVHRRTPIKGTRCSSGVSGEITADKIANPASISKWNSDMYGVDASKQGAQDYCNSLFELWASWGVDFVKVDDVCNTNMYPHDPYSGCAEIEMMHNAINNCGRPMVLSLSPGPALIDKAWHMSRYANMWRITDDFWDRWDLLKDMFRRCELWQAHVGPGCWPDCDMLPLGKIGVGFRKPRATNFTRDEQRTMMTLWCIFRSPLMMGGILPELDEWTLSLLANDEVIAVHQNGSSPLQIKFDNNEAIWKSDCENGDVNIALFNLSDEKRKISCPFSETRIGVYSKPDTLVQKAPFLQAKVRDLWNKKDLGVVTDAITAELPSHSASLFKVVC